MKKSITQNSLKLKTILLGALFLASFSTGQKLFAQQCSNVTFRDTFRSTIFTGGSSVVLAGLVTADFNRDGNQDFAVTQSETDSVFIFSGNGKGDFTRTVFVTVDAPRSLRTEDINLDGKNDLVVLSSDRAIVYIGDGTGGFNIGQTLLNINNVLLLDFNVDGKVDLLNASNNVNALKVFNGNGDGTFADAVDTPLPFRISNLVNGDFNRDGKTDLVASTTPGVANLVFLPGNDTGGFGTPTTFSSTNLGVGILRRIVNAGDINGDGRSDLIVIGNGSSDNSRILLGSANGVFTISTLLPSTNSIENIRAEDFNRDGKVDLALFNSSAVEIRLGNNNNTFVSAGVSFVSGSFIALNDFNNDGKQDVVADTTTAVRVGLNQCGGLTENPNSDFDGDGKADLSVFRPSMGTWFTLRSSNNTFSGVQWGTGGDIPAQGDYDGDGKADYAVFRPSSNSWFILKSKDGAVQSTGFGTDGDQPAPSDYDGDGKTDICVFRPSVGTWFRLNSSNGQFTAVQFGTNGDIAIH